MSVGETHQYSALPSTEPYVLQYKGTPQLASTGGIVARLFMGIMKHCLD